MRQHACRRTGRGPAAAAGATPTHEPRRPSGAGRPAARRAATSSVATASSGPTGVADDAQPLDRRDAIAQHRGRACRAAGELGEPGLAERLDDGPCRGERPRGLRPGHGRVDDGVAGPAGRREVLVPLPVAAAGAAAPRRPSARSRTCAGRPRGSSPRAPRSPRRAAGRARTASANPPMHASTCSAMPREAVIAATSATGSRLANGYDGALTTTSATSSPSRSSMSASGRHTGRRVDGHQVEFEPEVVRGLVERRVHGDRGDDARHPRRAERGPPATRRARTSRRAGSSRCRPT